jgi:hypothetical protein
MARSEVPNRGFRHPDTEGAGVVSERRRSKRFAEAEYILGVHSPPCNVALGLGGPNPRRTRIVLVGGDVALLAATAILTGTFIGLGFVPLLVLVILINKPRAVALTEHDLVIFRRSVWNGHLTSVIRHLSRTVLVASPPQVASYVAVGSFDTRTWIKAREYEQIFLHGTAEQPNSFGTDL